MPTKPPTASLERRHFVTRHGDWTVTVILSPQFGDLMLFLRREELRDRARACEPVSKANERVMVWPSGRQPHGEGRVQIGRLNIQVSQRFDDIHDHRRVLRRRGHAKGSAHVIEGSVASR